MGKCEEALETGNLSLVRLTILRYITVLFELEAPILFSLRQEYHPFKVSPRGSLEVAMWSDQPYMSRNLDDPALTFDAVTFAEKRN